MQKGSALQSVQYYKSEHVPKLFIVNEKSWKAMTIHQIYVQKDKSENFLYLSKDIDDIYIEEIKDMMPDSSAKFGDQYQNWRSKTGKDHAFDCIKYAYCLRDICISMLHKDKFLKMSPMLLKRFDTSQAKATKPTFKEKKGFF